jgi:pilus assembly protein CpaB
MRAVFGLVLLVGMGLAGFAVYMVSQQFDAREAELQRERQRASAVVQTVELYSPVRDITYGELLRPEDVKLILYPSANLPTGIYKTEEELFPAGVNTPRVVRIPMFINEPILEAKVTEAGAPQGISALLDQGMRAYPLPNNLTSAFAGDLRRNDRIDLFWVGTVRGAESSRLVKSGLEIISMSEPDENGEGGGTNIVLQVSQKDFADLRSLQTNGTLSLTPIARSDNEGGDITIQTNIEEVLGIEAIAVEVAPEIEEAPEICTRTERRGVDIVVIEFPCGE